MNFSTTDKNVLTLYITTELSIPAQNFYGVWV